MFKAAHMGVSPSQSSSHKKSYSCSKQGTSEEKPECCDVRTVVSQFGASDALRLSSENVKKDSLTEIFDPRSKNVCKSSLADKSLSPKLNSIDQQAQSSLSKDSELHCEDARRSGQTDKNSLSQQLISEQTPKFTSDGAYGEPSALLGTPHDDAKYHWNPEQSDTPSSNYAVNNSGQLGCRVKTTAKSRKMLRSLRTSERILRSRSQEKPKAPEPTTNQPNVDSNMEKTRKKKKKRRYQRIETDEYSRIKKHLRYLLNRISYEESLITAYSAKGWKGLSLEKLKPEKELQRASSEILRRKSKIRDLFQHIDSLCAEGRFPESLFDSDGQISSEDIFCAKCGSKDYTADNDIILCDGACDRGFHQFCLVPPLLKEDIPPGDEGWLCPGCDCKLDCIELLNDSQGTKIVLNDRWEKVFPEAASSGQNPDQNFGLPSDDSDDNDYNPNGPESDEKSQGDKSSSDDSDDSDFTSDELEAHPGDKQDPGLSSEDSEDDDFDPDAPDIDENVEEGSSSSDFTSDSEDLATLDNNELPGEDKKCMSIGARGDSNKEVSKRGQKKNQSIHSELLIEETNPGQDESAPISVRRNVERLDYKKLYDDTYGNVSSSSSDDEDFTDAVGPLKRRKSTKAASASANGNAYVINTGKQNLQETKCTPEISRPMCKSENTGILPAKACEGSSSPSTCGKTSRPSAYKRLGEAVTQGLYKAFVEDKYPDRAKKENLAKELGITFHQVSKWFDNTRWSFFHSSSTNASTVGNTSGNSCPVPEAISKPQPGLKTVSRSGTYNGAQRVENDDGLVEVYVQDGRPRETVLAIESCSAQKSKTPKSRKRKQNLDDQRSDSKSTQEGAKTAPTNISQAPETSAGRRVTRSKSAV